MKVKVKGRKGNGRGKGMVKISLENRADIHLVSYSPFVITTQNFRGTRQKSSKSESFVAARRDSISSSIIRGWS
jgi:hypothetical protein